MTNNIEFNENDIKDRVLDIVNKYDNSVSGVDDEAVLLDIKIDDLSKVQIAMEIERSFNVEFELNDMDKIIKVKDLVDFIETYDR